MSLRSTAKQIVRAIRPVKKGVPAVGDVNQIAAIYDDVFTNVEKYDSLDTGNAPKLPYILDYAKGVIGQVLDAGSGRGSVLRHVIENGVDAVGIEISPAACEKYLKGLPVVNTDIVSWAAQGHRYAGLINTDVLEHIPPDQIDKTIAALHSLSPTALLGIANHSSVHNGHELHVIQQGIGWWVRKLGEHYSRIEIVVPRRADEVLWANFQRERFFFMVVSG